MLHETLLKTVESRRLVATGNSMFCQTYLELEKAEFAIALMSFKVESLLRWNIFKNFLIHKIANNRKQNGTVFSVLLIQLKNLLRCSNRLK